MTLNKVFKIFEKLVIDNSPVILTGIGVTGVATTAFLTGKASFKAAEILSEELKYARNTTDPNYEMNAKRKVELTWKLYIPAIGTGIFTIASVIAANRIGTRRAAAMAAAYSISEKAFSEYREKVVEKLGEKKETDIRDEIAQNHITNSTHKEIVVLGQGNVLCFDSMTGRYFESSMETLRKAQNDLNHQILSDSYATLHDFYNLIGLPPTRYSQEVGWTDANLLDISFSTCLSADNRPCISIDYSSYPIRDYY